MAWIDTQQVCLPILQLTQASRDLQRVGSKQGLTRKTADYNKGLNHARRNTHRNIQDQGDVVWPQLSSGDCDCQRRLIVTRLLKINEATLIEMR